MDRMDNEFRKTVANEEISGVVLLAKNVKGNIDFRQCYGYRSIRESHEHRPRMTPDTVMRFASASKLLTSIMAMQCVERGVIDLEDQAIKKYLPEMSEIGVITGFDDAGNPKLREPKSPTTLRGLLSHSSGLPYVQTVPDLIRYKQWKGMWHGMEREGTYDTMEENFRFPLSYDPQEEWAYGPNLDWAGVLIQRATGMNLDDYMQRNICKPLGINYMTFYLQRRPDMLERLGDYATRDNESGKIHHEDNRYFHHDPIDCFGGQGIFTTPDDYMKVLWSLCSNDGRILRPETRDLMMTPCLTTKSEKRCYEQCVELQSWSLGGPIPPETLKTYGLGGMLTKEDVDGKKWRRKGNFSWSGLPCIVWQIDPETKLCSLFAFHMKPWGDKICFKLGRLFEETMFAQTGL